MSIPGGGAAGLPGAAAPGDGGGLTPRDAGRRAPAIAGLGLTEVGRVYGRTAADFAADAVRRATADAGLRPADLDGLLVSCGLAGGVDINLASHLGLTDLRLLTALQAFGSTAGSMVQLASLAVMSGLAEAVACVWADAPLREGRSAGSVYGAVGAGPAGRRAVPAGWGGLMAATGLAGTNQLYALATRRHMVTYGTTTEQLGHVAVAQRAWAGRNPLAQMRAPITLADHQASRWIAEPLRLLDCCLVSNGGAAVIVTTAERAAALARPPVHVLGWAQSHPGRAMRQSETFGLVTGAAQAGPAAMAMAGVSVGDVDVAQIYDCYTFTVLVTLEDYGFCPKGEGGPFVAGGTLGPGGTLAVNTGGGQLSGYYLWGMTPLTEAVTQARGDGGPRQAPRNDVVLVSGNGGVLDHHATLVLSPHPAGS